MAITAELEYSKMTRKDFNSEELTSASSLVNVKSSKRLFLSLSN